MVHPSIIQHHALALYEKSSELYDFFRSYDYVSEQTASVPYVTYALITVAVLSMIAFFAKLYQWCCSSSKQKTATQSIEAFAYEETNVP